MLSVHDLHKTFPGRRAGSPVVTALDGVDLEVHDGLFATVLGPSGSGKTTLLRCVAGFEEPDRGTISLDGRILDAPGRNPVRPDRRGIGIVPQEGALFPHLTVAQNIGFGLKDRSRAEKRARVATLLDLVDLNGYERRRPHQLSGGQQQRVALARALAPSPSLILLDEPFSALDAKLRVELRQQVRDLLRETNTTAVLVTHDQSEALTIADHLMVMRDGRAIAAGTPRHVYRSPTDLELATFLGEATVIPGHLSGDRTKVDCALGRLAVGGAHGNGESRGVCRVMIRPEQVRAGSADHADESDPNVGTVRSLSFHGDHSVLTVDMHHMEGPVLMKSLGLHHASEGDRVRLSVDGDVSTYPVASNT